MEDVEALQSIESKKASQLENFINEGLVEIKSAQFRKAYNRFLSRKNIEDHGFEVGQRIIRIYKSIETPQQLKELSDLVAQRCHFGEAHDPNSKEIKLAEASPWNADRVNPRGEINLPEQFYQEVALVYAEEWLHALQMLKGSLLTKGSQDPEIDVAKYMLSRGVFLTETYLDRYGRKQALYPQPSPTPTKPWWKVWKR